MPCTHTMTLPHYIRMRIVRAIEANARFDSYEVGCKFVLVATHGDEKRYILETPDFQRLHEAITLLRHLRDVGTADERKTGTAYNDNRRFYRRQQKARQESLKSTRVERLRQKFYGRAA